MLQLFFFNPGKKKLRNKWSLIKGTDFFFAPQKNLDPCFLPPQKKSLLMFFCGGKKLGWFAFFKSFFFHNLLNHRVFSYGTKFFLTRVKKKKLQHFCHNKKWWLWRPFFFQVQNKCKSSLVRSRFFFLSAIF